MISAGDVDPGSIDPGRWAKSGVLPRPDKPHQRRTTLGALGGFHAP
jgi:hypothetical protein